jgi:uncharacterized delta-60 repeat protein
MRSISRLHFALLCLAVVLGTIAPPLSADDGDLDLSFGGDGVATESALGLNTLSVNALAAADDGSLFAAGHGRNANSDQDLVVFRFLSSGVLDPAYGDDGVARIDFSTGGTQRSDELYAVRLLANGELLLYGRASTLDTFRAEIAQLRADGTLDPSFDGDGRRLLPPPPGSAQFLPLSAGASPAGRAVFFGVDEDQQAWLLVVGADGHPDSTFAGDGWKPIDLGAPVGSSILEQETVGFDAEGRILLFYFDPAGGERHLRVHRYLASGALDAGFSGDGELVVTDADATDNRYPVAFVQDPESGAVTFAARGYPGGDPTSSVLVRFEEDGTVDLAFGNFGRVELDYDEATYVTDLARQSDGRIAGVGFSDPAGPDQGVAFFFRLLPDGDLDATFDANGLKWVDVDEEPNWRDEACAVAISGGKLAAAGRSGGGPGNVAVAFRLESRLIFTDGFERGTDGAW